MTSVLNQRSPGPAAYNTPSSFGVKKGANRFSFTGKQRQLQRQDKEPGPDKYSNTKSTLGGAKVSIGARTHHDKKDDSEPGPGRYFEKSLPSSIGGPKHSLTGKLRVRQTHVDDVPAPNKYNPDAASNRVKFKPPSFSMSAKTAFRLREKDDTPGPGAHDISKINPIGKQGPAVRLTGKPTSLNKHLRDQAGMPGPGHFAGANKNMIGVASPKFSMGKRFRDGISQGFFDAPRTVVQNDK